MSFFIQDLHLNFNSFLGFQHRSDLSVKAIVQVSATLPLVIGSKNFWFLIALLLYPKSAILGLSLLDLKDLCLANQFSRGSWQKSSVSTYLTWCQRRNRAASMIELTLISILHMFATIWRFSGQHLTFPWRCWTEFS